MLKYTKVKGKIMIREIIKPTNNNFTITIPNEYINQEIEFILFPLNSNEIIETTYKPNKKQDISTLGGSLNKYANPSKIELEDKAWDLHIMDKYQ